MKKENQNIKEHIVFLGNAGFPIGLAEIQRITIMAKALLYVGFKVTVISRKGVWEKNQEINFNKKGNFEGIDYIYTSNSVFRPKGFINRNTQKLKGLYREFRLLKRLKRHDKINLAIVSSMSAVHVLRYCIYSTYLNFPIAINFVEMASSMEDRTDFLARVNDYILDKWVIKLFDGALPISDNLMSYYQKVSPHKPNLKLPILCDFEKFNITKERNQEPYFLYCGSVDYEQVRDFVIEAYSSITNQRGYKLYMIISAENQFKDNGLQERLQKKYNTTNIKVFSNIPYQELVNLYVNAKAMLIPLRNTLQDTSRFPHKIGEYLASGNPVITTYFGEIQNYFQDGQTALIADTYDVSAFAKKMKFALDYPEESQEIGLNGKKLGLKEFDYKILGSRLQKFLQEF